MATRMLAASLAAVFCLVAPGVASAAAGDFPLERTDIELDVAGSVVGATVTQRFHNPYSKPIAVVYQFPLPDHAAVDAMEMKIGARTITGSIAPREEARAAYAAAIKDGRRAALLEQERPNMFTYSLGNVDAGATIEVKLHYFEVAHFDHGTYSLAVPTTIGPRFIPSGVADADRVQTVSDPNTGAKIGFHAKVDAGTPLESITAPDWNVEIKRPTANIANIQLRSDHEVGNRDFVLKWRAKAESVEPALFTHKASTDSDGYLTLMLEPKHALSADEIAPRELVFLLDTSGSMQGAPIATATAAVNMAIDKLGANDTFTIIDFADKASAFSRKPLPNTPENRKRGHDYINHLEAAGGTNQLVGIHAALSLPGDEFRTRYVVFMTDGFIGNDDDVIALTRKEIGKAHIFSFGIGASVNRYLLDEVAAAGRGYAEYMQNAGDKNELVERFYTRIGLPFMTDISIDWGGLAIADQRPTAIPDLSALEPLVVHARYAKAGAADITIKGKIAGKTRTQKLHVVLPDNAPEHGALEKLWARATILDLERTKHPDAREITRVAVAHSLMSKYTAFIGTDSTGPEGGGEDVSTIRQPNEQPMDAPAPVYSESESAAYAEAPPSAPPHGGCAGCTATPKTSDRAGLGALALLALIVVRRRRSFSRA